MKSIVFFFFKFKMNEENYMAYLITSFFRFYFSFVNNQSNALVGNISLDISEIEPTTLA